MMNTISFMSANFVARELGYHMTEGWMQGDGATQAYFRPIETFAERFESMLAEIKAMGFSALDIWGAHLSPDWATDAYIAIVRDLLQKHRMTIASYATWLGSIDYLERSCQIMRALDISILGGGGTVLDTNYQKAVALFREYGIVYGYENHPERSAAEILAKIGERDTDVIGVAIDTGWVEIQNADAVETTRALLPRIKYVHLKDVLERGGHVSCRYGQGLVNVQGCVQLLQAHGYTGGYSVEHEPETYDPTDDVTASAKMLREWLGG
jgi:L-ribulose-5-phosphate 3-epimerase